MKQFYTTFYTLHNTNIVKPLKISIMSDIHYNNNITNQKLQTIKNHLLGLAPNYIFIVGDLLDSSDTIKDKKERDRLLNWLRKLGTIAPVLISLGNHDSYKKSKYKWKYFYDELFFEAVNQLDNVSVLNNSYYEDDIIYVMGINNSFNYYHSNISTGHVLVEDSNKMIADLRKNIILPPNNKLSFILIHSPLRLLEPKVEQVITPFNYYVSGHMHNGCVLPLLDRIWDTSVGLIAPSKTLFPKNARNTIKTEKDKLIVNGAITTLSKCSGFLRYFNILYPMYDTVLEFSNNEVSNQEMIKKKKM